MSTPERTRPRRRRRRRPPPGQPPRRRQAARRAGGEAPQPKPLSETTMRVLWALPWAAFAITIIIVGDAVFAVAVVMLAAICIAELFTMAKAARPFALTAMIGAGGLVAAAYLGDHYSITLALAATFPLIFAAVALRGSVEGVTASVAVTVLGIVWIGLPFAHAVLLRELPDHGTALLVDVLIATILADTAAYAGGRAFGRHRLSSPISPNKTVEGLAFGLIGGTLGFWVAGLYQDWLPGTDALAMGAVIALVAPIGDLFESAVKRDLGVKDSGTAMGPHGGLLDRLDAVLFTIVAGYYLSVAFIY